MIKSLLQYGLLVVVAWAAACTSSQPTQAPEPPAAEAVRDIQVYFREAQRARGVGLARKTRLVDARPARPGEVVVTTILGEGVETQSRPAQAGDMVVRNRCPETGNEEILVSAISFAERYDGPTGAATEGGWRPYRPRGVQMRYVIVARQDGAFSFVAPWGEQMRARPGDSIVQSLEDPSDTYRIARAAFACTYDVLEAPRPPS